MALKVLMLRKKLESAKAKLAALREARKDIERRGAELETDINDAKTPEEQAVVEEAVNAHEAEDEANASEIAAAEAEVSQLEGEIAEAEAKAQEARSANPANNNTERREPPMEMNTTEVRARNHFGMNRRQRSEFAARQENKDFVARARTFLKEKRSVSGAELTIPVEILEVMRDNLHRYSKLVGYVRKKSVGGKSRQNILGTAVEGVWTEAVGSLNELDFTVNQVEVDGFKVGGFVVIPNSYLEDSDVNLLFEIMDQISQAIGLAVDKAIVYGTGSKMPIGIVTRLAATSQPSWWGTDQGTFTDLHTSNIHTLNIAAQTGVNFFTPLLEKLGIVSGAYSASGNKVWLMSENTHTVLSIKALAFNAAAALLSGVNKTMPVLGGDIIELPFIPNGDIIGGYLDLYLLAERAGTKLRSSDHAKFTDDQTVCLGLARYDGNPVRGEGYVAVNINNAAVTTSVDFAADTANTPVNPGAAG